MTKDMIQDCVLIIKFIDFDKLIKFIECGFANSLMSPWLKCCEIAIINNIVDIFCMISIDISFITCVI